MDPATAGLFTAGIGLARDVLHYVMSETSGSSKTTTTVTVVRERVLDPDRLQQLVGEATRHFSTLLDFQTETIVDQLRRDRARDAVQELQARVKLLRSLTSTPVADKSVALQLVISSLNPLQVSLEVAKFRLKDLGDTDSWQFCHLLGTSALVAGYAFLGEDVAEMAQELEAKMRSLQEELMDETARLVVLSGNKLPWDRISLLISPEGIEELLSLFEEYSKVTADLHPDPTEMKAKEARKTANSIFDANVIEKMLRAEQEGKSRSTVIDALNDRLRFLGDE